MASNHMGAAVVSVVTGFQHKIVHAELKAAKWRWIVLNLICASTSSRVL